MPRSREAELRRLLFDLDERLLKLVTAPEPMDPERLRHIAACETSRQAVQRLLTQAETEAEAAPS